MQKEAPSQSTGQKVDHVLSQMDSNVFRLKHPIVDGASVQCSYTLPVCVYTVLIIVCIITHSAYKYYRQYCQAREYFHLLGTRDGASFQSSWGTIFLIFAIVSLLYPIVFEHNYESPHVLRGSMLHCV